jgi:hypothetical protein
VWDHGGGGGTTSSMTFSGPEKVPSQRSRVASRPSALIEHGWDFSILGRASAHIWTAAGATFATTTGPLLTHLRTPSNCLDGVSRCGPVRRGRFPSAPCTFRVRAVALIWTRGGSTSRFALCLPRIADAYLKKPLLSQLSTRLPAPGMRDPPGAGGPKSRWLKAHERQRAWREDEGKMKNTPAVQGFIARG